MRIVRVRRDHKTWWGRIDEDLIVLLEPAQTGSIEELSRVQLSGSGEHIQLGEARLLPPIAPPRNVFCLGANYREHVEEGPEEFREIPPVWFSKATTALTGPYDDVFLDTGLTSQLDWEVELAVVIGVGGRAIRVEAALNHVFGYLVLNDLSARDVQLSRGGQWFLGKSIDTYAPAGPWIVTSESIADPQRLDISLSVNGVPKQQASTSQMILSVREAISDLSRFVTLLPGDIISTGTPAGVGLSRKPPEYLTHGDVVEATVSSIGTLRNRIVERTDDSTLGPMT